jgi:hypothetical protein
MGAKKAEHKRKRGFIAEITHAVRQIGHAVPRIVGPTLIAGGSVVLAAPVVGAGVSIARAGRGNSVAGVQATIADNFTNQEGQYLMPAALMIGSGIVIEKATARLR